jgi:catalase
MTWKHLLTLVVAVATAAAGTAETPAPAKKPLTEDGGQPVGNNQNSRTAGPEGPVLLDDFHLVQKLARFDRERIPERVVHARGVGAHGEFVSAGDFSRFTKARLFGEKGKKTPVFVRFSTVIHPNGSPESLRDPRGFAVKFYTEQGNWDLVGNNLPVFFIRDAMKFPDMVHSLKPSPVTNQQDPNRFFDFFSHVPESTHMLTFVYSDRGTPANLRQMDGFGVHAFKWVNDKSEVTYVKFHWRSLQGIKNHTAEEAAAATAKNHSNHTADLYESIKAGEFPSWELAVQLLPVSDLGKTEYDPLDATKVWPGVPEMVVGKMTLNRVPENFFQSTEQAAFSPGMVVPGIEPSEDRLLQGRLFSYADTQRYRIGANYLDVPVNRPVAPVANNNQDGALSTLPRSGDVNYEPSVTTAGRRDDARFEASKAPLTGSVQQRPIDRKQDFAQAGDLYRSLTDSERENLIKNLAGDLGKVKNAAVKLKMTSHFYRADTDYGTRLARAVGLDVDEVRKLAAEPEAAKK